MKTLLCLALFSISSISADISNPDITILETILIPKSKILSSENLGAGLPVYATEVKINLGKTVNWEAPPHGVCYCLHTGIYIGGNIITTIQNCWQLEGFVYEQNGVGHQVVTYQGPSGEMTSESTNWKVETIEGKKCIAHIHPDFTVYSSQSEQFIIKN